MANKSSTKKVLKKEPIKAKKAKVNEVKEEPKQETKRLLTRTSTAILYFLCGGCWLISAILYSTTKQKPIFDIILGLLFIGIGILYLVKERKEKNIK